jgi:hypothetical protein
LFGLSFGGGLLFAIVYPEGKLSEFKRVMLPMVKDRYDDALLSLLPDLSRLEPKLSNNEKPTEARAFDILESKHGVVCWEIRVTNVASLG